MRDPERIQRIVNKLQQAWEYHPDIRLGQLLCNLVFSRNPNADLFYTPDSNLEAWIDIEIKAMSAHQQSRNLNQQP